MGASPRTGGGAALLAVCLAGVTLAACAAPSPIPTTPPAPVPTPLVSYGSLDGELRLVTLRSAPLAGSIFIRSAVGTTVIVAAGTDGRFSTRLPVGRYTVTGRSPSFDSGTVECFAPEPVSIGSDAAITVLVACEGY